MQLGSENVVQYRVIYFDLENERVHASNNYKK